MVSWSLKGTDIIKYKKSLKQKGHQINIRDMTSGLHAIVIKDGKLYSGVDPRREGVAIGH